MTCTMSTRHAESQTHYRYRPLYIWRRWGKHRCLPQCSGRRRRRQRCSFGSVSGYSWHSTTRYTLAGGGGTTKSETLYTVYMQVSRRRSVISFRRCPHAGMGYYGIWTPVRRTRRRANDDAGTTMMMMMMVMIERRDDTASAACHGQLSSSVRAPQSTRSRARGFQCIANHTRVRIISNNSNFVAQAYTKMCWWLLLILRI